MPHADRQKRLEYHRKWNHENYRKNRAKEMRRIADRKGEITKWFSQLKSTLRCEQCGESEPICLDFHHVQQKDFNLGQLSSWGWGKARISKELEKCIVLCANCHRKLHAGRLKIAGSANGKPRDSGSRYLGSNPSPAATNLGRFHRNEHGQVPWSPM